MEIVNYEIILSRTIKELLNSGQIDVRSYTVLSLGGISNLKEIIIYYEKNLTFKKIRCAGRKTDESLKALVHKYKKLLTPEDDEIFKNNDEETRIRENINSSMSLVDLQQYELLRVRTKNVLSFGGLLNIKEFLDYYKTHKKFLKIRKCGPRTNIELIDLAEIILRYRKKEIFDENVYENENYLKYKKFIRNLNESFKLEQDEIENIIFQIIEGRLEIFNLFTLCAKKYLKEIYFNVLVEVYSYENDKRKVTLKEIAEKVNRTRERVRQIKEINIHKFINKFKLLVKKNNIENEIFANYIDENEKVIKIDEELREKIAYFDNKFYSNEIAAKLLALVYKNTFSLYNIEKGNKTAYFLINNELLNGFRMNLFIENLERRFNRKKNIMEVIRFETLVKRYVVNDDEEVFEKAKDVCKKIINNSFNFHINETGFIREDEDSQIDIQLSLFE